MVRPQVASRSEVARGLRASGCAATPRRGSLLYKRERCGLLAVCCGLALCAQAQVKVYTERMDPRKHPDEARRTVHPPSRETFGNRMQFITLRTLGGKEWKERLDTYTKTDRLGDIVWPNFAFLFKPDCLEKVEELKRRGLFLFDIWGFVPGSSMDDGEWPQFVLPEGILDRISEQLGDQWFGMDNGEQDGRYIGAFARQQYPFGDDRFAQYLNFQRHFERMDLLLGNKMATLVSLNYGHHFLRENCYTMIGAETSMSLPNAQVYYAFIRGAGKQYGVPWFGNVSVFNRWGFKAYPQKVDDDPKKRSPGPERGTSLALLKKLLYAQMFYNSLAVGMENGWYWGGRYTSDGKTELSPIGRIQQGAVDWSAKYGDPGVHQAPVALMVDVYSGWTFPRHVYSDGSYRVWGNLPYEEGDYLTDGILRLVYPGYEDSAFYRDERGYNSDTPYGDIFDCVLSDAPAWMLKQYAALVLAGRLTPGDELRETLLEYVRAGGELCLTLGNAAALFPKGTDGLDCGRGRIVLIGGGDWGVVKEVSCPMPISVKTETPLPSPHPLTAQARADLDGVFRRYMLFGSSAEPATNGLSVVTCRRARGEYTLCLMNNTWQERPFELTSHVGRIVSVEELPTVDDVKPCIGYWPMSVSNRVAGADTPRTIAAGSVRMFRVKVDEGGDVVELPAVKPVANPMNRILYLRNVAGPIKEAVLARPTFFRHYDGVMVDWRYVAARDEKELAAQTNWLRLQGLKVSVDLSSGLNLYPDLRLDDGHAVESNRTAAAIDGLLSKMSALGSRDLLVATHREPFYMEDAKAAIARGLRTLCRKAAAYGVTVRIRQYPMRFRTSNKWELADWLKDVKEPNLYVARSLATEIRNNGMKADGIDGKIGQATGWWLMSAPAADMNGKLWSLHRPIAGFSEDLVPRLDALRAPDVTLVFDALYPDIDAEYRDVRLFEQQPQSKGDKK